MRWTILLILLVLAAGCSTITAPGLSHPSDLTNYFWPDSNVTYVYQSVNDTHTLTYTKGGGIADIDKSSGDTTSISISNYSLSGLSASDLFGLDSGLQVVQDTTLISHPLAIRSIASAGNKLLATSDDSLYEIVADALSRPVGLPHRGVQLYDNGGPFLYAYVRGGDSIFSSMDEGHSWTRDGLPAPATGITGIIPDDGQDLNGDVLWVAAGNNLYGRSPSAWKIYSAGGLIGALTSNGDSIFAGINNGGNYTIVAIDRDAHTGTVPRIVCSSSGIINRLIADHDHLYIGTNSGLYIYDLRQGAFMSHPDFGNVTALAMANPFVVVGHMDGKIGLWDGIYQPEGSAGSGAVTQFAFSPPPVGDVFARTDSTVYDNTSNMTWAPIRVPPSRSGAGRPGSFTLLANNPAGWQAGFVESMKSSFPRSYTYQASYLGHADSIVLDSIGYHDAIMIQYTAFPSNSITPDATDIPQYLIYFERNVGPIRIEKTEKGLTTVTRLVKPM
jgi:hypothetical protein